MKPLRKLLDSVEPHFVNGGKFERFYPLYEAADTFLYTPPDVTNGQTHVRDALDLKRLMITVAMALGPCILVAMLNTGYQAQLAFESVGAERLTGWRGEIMSCLGFGVNSGNILANLILGALYFIPVFLVSNIAGGIAEAVFSIVRKHEINEGFLVTGMLYPLILPATIPLWQAAIGIVFAVIIAKEAFGGTGKNFLNIALTARAFLYFAYPGQISGDAVWIAGPEGHTGATILGIAAADGMQAVTQSYTWLQSFIGTIPGSMGETSVIACLMGAAFLIMTGIGSARIMVCVVIGTFVTSFLLNTIGSDTNPMFAMSPWWHFVVGGFAFGTVFMATDPVSAAMTNTGKILYGLLIGFMTVLIRVINPAFPEGIMLAILFANVFAPLFDYYVVKSAIRRRRLRHV